MDSYVSVSAEIYTFARDITSAERLEVLSKSGIFYIQPCTTSYAQFCLRESPSLPPILNVPKP